MTRQITPRQLADMQAVGETVFLLDVRQPEEYAICRLASSVLIPLSDLPTRLREIDPEPGVPVVVYCHLGIRSFKAAQFLEQAGLSPVFSLAGGIDAWSQEIDPAVPRY